MIIMETSIYCKIIGNILKSHMKFGTLTRVRNHQKVASKKDERHRKQLEVQFEVSARKNEFNTCDTIDVDAAASCSTLLGDEQQLK